MCAMMSAGPMSAGSNVFRSGGWPPARPAERRLRFRGLSHVDSDTGRINGLPTRPGTTMVKVQVTDAANHIATSQRD